MFVDFNILNQLGSPSINSNTFANRPSAGQVGRLFVSTDTFEIYRDTGTGWDLIGGPGTSTVTGSGAAGQVTYWTGTNSVGGENNLWWDAANNHLGINTSTPGVALDVHSAADVGVQFNGTGATPSILQAFLSAGVSQYEIGYNWNSDINYRRFSIYDVQGAKEVISIDQQSRFVGINYQYSSLSDQPAYTLDVSGSGRFTDSAYFVTSGSGNVLIGSTTVVGSGILQVTGTANVTNSTAAQTLTVSGNGNANTTIVVSNNNSSTGAGCGFTSASDIAVGDIIVTSSTNTTAALGGRANALAIRTNSAATGGIALMARNGASGIITFHTSSNTERARYSINGNLLINTTIDVGGTNKLQVAGNVYLNAAGGGDGLRYILNNTSASEFQYAIVNGGSSADSFQRLSLRNGSYGTNLLQLNDVGTAFLQEIKAGKSSILNTTAAENGTGGGNRQFDLSFTPSGTNGFNGTDNGDQGYGYFPVTITSGKTYEIKVTMATTNGAPLVIISSTTKNFATSTVDTIESAPLNGTTYHQFTATGNAAYIGFGFSRSGGTLDATVSNFSIVEINGVLVTNTETVTVNGKIETTGTIKTGAPTTGTAAEWKLGQRVAAAVVLDATQYIEVEVGGTFYKLAIVT